MPLTQDIGARKIRSIKLGGGAINVLISGGETEGRAELFDFQVPPDHPGAPVHIHDRADEFFAILDGEAEFVIDGQKILVPAGSNIVAPRGVAHGWRNASEKPLRLLVTFSPAIGMESYFVALAEIARHSWPPERGVLEELWTRCDTRPA